MTGRAIAIVGAGIAGATCCHLLRQAGHDVHVFDKSRGVGGRMSTRRGDGWACDHGAQYFTARDPDFRAEVDRWCAAGVAAAWHPRLAVLGGTRSAASSSGTERFVGAPSMTAPVRHLTAAAQLHLSHTVDRITLEDAGWRLASREGGLSATSFDTLVLAVPAPQAVPLLQPLAPHLAELAGRARMRACWAAWVSLPTALDLPFDAAFVNEGPLRWVARNRAKPGRDGAETWLLHANADWSDAHVEAEPAQVVATLARAFAELGGPADAPVSAHRWRYAECDPPLQQGHAWDRELRLGLCGDWLDTGKVEGAWRSGTQLAHTILATIA